MSEIKQQNDDFRTGVAAGVFLATVILLPILMSCMYLISKTSMEDGRQEMRFEAVRSGNAVWDKDEEGQPIFRWTGISI